ncbi:MAG TPA: 2-amino-4-hydroxy-6-hydroxymethyldihydropteridine diphosphokinase [Polyangiaceae bacterium]|nr:2-amino-4-hydroxy-6-hydroxymethyldihydropteridine diphosphokinase [Polyangiaceae bacterium]HMR74946.1 2-amino-4-hydroxy-6-hydroxymethyldihydropteridine diphosphokinase [Polyangiaceae bacterium]
MVDLVFGLGANLGDRAAALRSALHVLASLGRITAVSGLFETAPVGGPSGQGPHFNAAVRLSTEAEPARWLLCIGVAEREAGRTRTVKNGPRTLDVDALWARETRVVLPELVVPHPRLAERPFAWIPLLEVAPDAAPPGGAPPYRQALTGYDWSGVTPYASAKQWCPEFPSEIELLRPI